MYARFVVEVADPAHRPDVAFGAFLCSVRKPGQVAGGGEPFPDVNPIAHGGPPLPSCRSDVLIRLWLLGGLCRWSVFFCGAGPKPPMSHCARTDRGSRSVRCRRQPILEAWFLSVTCLTVEYPTVETGEERACWQRLLCVRRVRSTGSACGARCPGRDRKLPARCGQPTDRLAVWFDCPCA